MSDSKTPSSNEPEEGTVMIAPGHYVSSTPDDAEVVLPVESTETKAPLMEPFTGISVELVSGKSCNYVIFKNKNDKRLPKHLVCLIDVSISMNDSISDKKELRGYSRLDLVKHSFVTLIDSIDKDDRLTIISFNDVVKKIFDDYATESNRSKAKKIVLELKADRYTNIRDSISTGWKSIIEHKNTNSVILLFTDGAPTSPWNSVQTINAFLKSENKNLAPIISIGYGSQLEFPVLEAYSQEDGCAFLHIPDSSVISSVFANMIANVLSRDVYKARVFINNKLRKIYTNIGSTKIIEVSKFHNVEINDTRLNVTNRNLTEFEQKMISRINFADYLKHFYSLHTPNNIENIITEMKNTFDDSDILDNLVHNDAHKGQVSKALEKKYFDDWGKFYIFMLYTSHINQEKCNDLETSTIIYGSEYTEKIRKKAKEIFDDTPAPPPSRSSNYDSSSISLSMSSYSSSNYYQPRTGSQLSSYSSGCFDGNSHAKVKDGNCYRFVKVSDLKKGDLVYTGNNENSNNENGNNENGSSNNNENDHNDYDEVECVVKTTLSSPVHMVALESEIEEPVLLTPYHPVFHNGKWQFPCTLARANKYRINAFYNLILKRRSNVWLNGVIAITLGHGIKKDPVAYHHYFGSQLVIRDCSMMPGYDSGLIDLQKCTYIRSVLNDCRIIGMVRKH